ncbi:MAG: MoaD/ThiS family protein [Verrucomicrobia bacterium]|jgi:molybdopterin converting factor small subunit|nr:MoaD/ThiS family protein [Verrucomicrobiota bacterium]MBT7066715.1 MoaD/ThiS family protein [Verrucomicrobiota bacterium]MBT7700794.1 MoaD/ThiS family protein [Verrucomicrobiota bacterium]
MTIRVEYMSQLRVRTDCHEEAFAVAPGTDLAGLLRAIAEKHGDTVRELLLDEAGEPTATVLCFVASEQVDRNHILNEGDVVTLMTPISGG